MAEHDRDRVEPPLYRATVPVFMAVLDRIEAMLGRTESALGPGAEAALAQRPAAGMLPAGQQVATAVQFTLRVAFPLAGRRVPEPRDPLDGAGLRARVAATRALLAGLDPAEFDGAEWRRVRAQAGFAELDLAGEAFLHAFGLPNLYFHQSMAHVALKQAGVPLGKADFDGQHDYPEGFSFG
jgi:uncharacterized protein